MRLAQFAAESRESSPWPKGGVVAHATRWRAEPSCVCIRKGGVRHTPKPRTNYQKSWQPRKRVVVGFWLAGVLEFPASNKAPSSRLVAWIFLFLPPKTAARPDSSLGPIWHEMTSLHQGPPWPPPPPARLRHGPYPSLECNDETNCTWWRFHQRPNTFQKQSDQMKLVSTVV